MASLIATLDGRSVVNGDEIELYKFTPGSHTLKVTAVDNAGNIGIKTVTFNIVATVGSLQDLVNISSNRDTSTVLKACGQVFSRNSMQLKHT